MTDDLDREFNVMADCVAMIETAREDGLHIGHDLPDPPDLEEMVALFDQARRVPVDTYRMYIDGELVSEGRISLDRSFGVSHSVYSHQYQPCQWDHLHLQPRLPRERKTLWQRIVLWIRNNVVVRWR